MSDGESFFSFTLLFTAIVGLCLGSFANVIIWRWPENWSILWPPSHCPSCYSPISAVENIPVLSWIALGGRCSSCGSSISLRYPLVEVLTSSLCVGVVCVHGISFTSFELCFLMFGLVVVSFIDIDRMILPDLFTISGIFLGIIGASINPDRLVAEAMLGFFLGGFVLWFIGFVYTLIRREEGMGGGDVKLLAWIGAFLGWKSVIFVLLASSLLGSVVGVIVMLRTKGGLKTRIPFGPYLATGAGIYAIAGERLIDWYLALFFVGPALR